MKRPIVLMLALSFVRCSQTELFVATDGGQDLAAIDVQVDAQIDATRVLRICLPCSPQPPPDCENREYVRRYDQAVGSCGAGLCPYEPAYVECAYGCQKGECITHQNEWLPMSTVNAPAGRKNHTAVWTGSEMVVWGGQTKSGTVGDGAAYSPKTDSWRPVSTVGAPTARLGHAAYFTLGGEMVVWGGRNGDSYFNDGALYDPNADKWRRMQPTFETLDPRPPPARAYHSAVYLWGSRASVPGLMFTSMVALGGKCARPDVHSNPGVYDFMFGIWLTVPGAKDIKTDVVGLTSLFAPPYVATLGGVFQDGSYSETDYLYEPFADKLLTMTPWLQGDIPMSPRKFHTATWVGSHFVVWGGQPKDKNADPRLTGHFFPNANAWLSGTSRNAPSARQEHRALWNYKNMLVWGGQSLDTDGRVLDTGGIYDYKKPAWRPIPQAGAPEPRYRHTAIWTTADPGEREEMIIWGGLSGREGDPNARLLNSGGRYSP